MMHETHTLDSLLALNPSELSEYCRSRIDPWSLLAPFSRRKDLCEYLGIGESTLSGWLKDKGIPQMAANAVVLAMVHKEIKGQARIAKELKVVRSGQHYQIVDFHKDEEGEVIGRVVADHVSTLEDARLLASSRRSLSIIEETEMLFNYVTEMAENEDFLKPVKELWERIEANTLFLTDYESWKSRYGQKSSAIDMDHLLEETPNKKHRKKVAQRRKKGVQ